MVIISIVLFFGVCGSIEESGGFDGGVLDTILEDGIDLDGFLMDLGDDLNLDVMEVEFDEGFEDVLLLLVIIKWEVDDLDLSEEYVFHSIWGLDYNYLIAVGTKVTIIENFGSGWEVVY